MANQLVLTLSGTATQGSYKDVINPGSLTVALSGQGAASGVQEIGTTAEDLSYGDVAAANVGWLWIRNLDGTNYVDWGLNDSASLKAVGRLEPGEWAICRVKPSAQVMLQANTAACNVEYRLYRD